jgi:hypothetical protein
MIRLASALLALTTLPWQPATAAGAEPVQPRLRAALTCQGDALGAIYALEEGGSQFAQGYAIASIGEELDSQVLVVLEQPLTIAGASTQLVRGGPSTPEAGFGGLVYARFRGDHAAVVKELNLHAPAADAPTPELGRFQRAVPLAGEESSMCPPMIVLTPLEDGEFLLGCGWCNGG